MTEHIESNVDDSRRREFIHLYPTWSSFVERLKNHGKLVNRHVSDPASQSVEHGIPPWSGTATWEEALSYLDTGWNEGIKRIKKIQHTIPADLFDCIMPVTDYRPEQHHVIAGGALDVGQFVTGASPENFVAEQIPVEGGLKQQGKKLITVYVQSFGSAITDWDCFFYRGAYAFSLVEHLENCGYSVELWMVQYMHLGINYHNRQIQKIYVKVKEFGELFDTNKLAVSLCAPFYQRRYLFALQETYGDYEVKTCDKGYGSPIQDCEQHIGRVTLPDDKDLHPLWIGYVNIGTKEETLQQYRRLLEDWVSGDVVQE